MDSPLKWWLRLLGGLAWGRARESWRGAGLAWRISGLAWRIAGEAGGGAGLARSALPLPPNHRAKMHRG